MTWIIGTGVDRYNQLVDYSRLVYTTDGGARQSCPTCGRKLPKCVCGRLAQRRGASEHRGQDAPSDGVVRVFRDRGGRKGKTVTLVTGIPRPALSEVATALKRAAAAGGATRDDAIEIQGDHRDLVAERLSALGYRVKLAGG